MSIFSHNTCRFCTGAGARCGARRDVQHLRWRRTMPGGFPLQDTGPGMAELFHDLATEQEERRFATPLPVISLWQPFASLIFRGRKKNETRPKGTPLPDRYVGVPVGIAATASFPPLKIISEELHELCMDEFGCGYNHTLPLGCILGTVVFDYRVPTEDRQPADDDDRIAGDWRAGRFAWPIKIVRPWAATVPAKGKQGWWSYKLNASR